MPQEENITEDTCFFDTKRTLFLSLSLSLKEETK